ncbi:MAG: SLC13 family permease [Thermoanaerobaculia bacterium]|nr:SLC13 family permease [Thermoanaerobaculia bacterium]
MTIEIVLMLALLVGCLVLFATELLPIEVTAFLVLAVLVASGTISVDEAVVGFSNKAVVAIGSLFVLSHALTKTGLLEYVADRLGQWAANRHWLGIAVLMALVSVLSGFLNNTAIVAIFIPLVLDLSSKLGLSPSRILLPLSYASIFGGTLTLIGTSTNLLVSAIAEEAGQAPFGMFEFSQLGSVFLLFGLTYVLLFGPRLLPERVRPGDLTRSYGLGPYLTEIEVPEESSLVGQSPRDAGIGERFDINVLSIIRGDQHLVEAVGTVPLVAGDLLVLQAPVDELMRLKREHDVSLLPEVKLSEEELTSEGLVAAEMLIKPDSSLVGRTLGEADFRRRFGGFVMAVRRHGETLREKVARTALMTWDALLTLVPKDRLDELRRSEDVIVLTELPVKLGRQRMWWLVLLVLPVVVGLAAFGVIEIAGGALLGVILLLVVRVITPREAYDSIQWSVIFLIAAFVPVGQALIDTGTADFIASGLITASEMLPIAPALATLSLLYLTTSLLTQIVSNAAAAIVLSPIAIALAGTLGVDARPLLMAVCFAASAEFMTPVGYQTNLMVYGPGGYHFLDYTKFGAPLNIAFWLLATLLIPYFWPF